MKRLSVYVQHLTKYDALALVLSSGQPVTARFATGDRASSQPIDHSQIVAMIEEAAPPEAPADLLGGRTARFGYDETGTAVTIEASATGNNWRVTISPGAYQAPAAARAAAPVVTAPVSPPPAAALRGFDVDDGPPGIDRWLRMMSRMGGSDLHISSGNPPMFRLHGEIRRLEESAPWDHERLKALIYSMMPQRNRD